MEGEARPNRGSSFNYYYPSVKVVPKRKAMKDVETQQIFLYVRGIERNAQSIVLVNS